jgi:hypothetical protein
MLGWLFRRPGLKASSLKTAFNSSFYTRSSTASFQRARSFWTSSRLGQRYRYSRFNDPYPNQPHGSSGYFQNFWYRTTPAQRVLLVGLGGGAPIFYVTHLETVEPTGRRRFIFMSRSMEESLGKMVNPYKYKRSND